MIIYLSSSLGQVAQTPTGTAQDSLECLAIAAREGNHVLLGDRGTLKRLAAATQLSNKARAEFKRIEQQTTSMIGLVKQAVACAVVVDPAQPSVSDPVDAEVTIELPLSFFTTTQSIQSTTLLCENLNDGHLVQMLAESWRARKRLSFPAKSQLVAGGGSTTAHSLANLESQHRFVLTVVDSDRRFSSDGLGETASKCVEAHNKTVRNSHLLVLAQREVENLLPLTCLATADGGAPHAAVALYSKAVDASHHEFVAFHDWKNGLTARKLFEIGEVCTSNFAAQAAAHCTACIATPKCSSSAECECTVLPGFGVQSLQRFVLHAKELTPHKLGELLAGAPLPSEIEALGRTAWSWTCGSAKRVS